ncbi:MAG: hypothetical protein WKG07_16430 [Hymenobacter sp.]
MIDLFPRLGHLGPLLLGLPLLLAAPAGPGPSGTVHDQGRPHLLLFGLHYEDIEARNDKVAAVF